MNHALIVPVLLPAACAVLMLLAGDERIRLQRALALLACAGLAVVALGALGHTSAGAITVYRLGDWPAPFGIALVLDRLAALMLGLTAVVAIAALVAAMTGPEPWDRRGRFFHALFQFQLMGLNGAFLSGDLFNLFVFFEVLLVASYCLLLHGRGPERLRAGFHYVAVNLAASALFLLAIAALYAVTGTLNLADLALAVPRLGSANVPIARAAALVLLAVFAVKAAVFPLHLWLPRAYVAAGPPVAALFAIMTKVGVYAIVRVYGLVFGPDAGGSALIAGPWLLAGAVATVALGAVGAFAATSLARMAAYLTVASVGTLLVGVAVFSTASLGAALYYLLHSTLALAALFLLVERIAAQRGGDGFTPRPPVAQPAVARGRPRRRRRLDRRPAAALRVRRQARAPPGDRQSAGDAGALGRPPRRGPRGDARARARGQRALLEDGRGRSAGGARILRVARADGRAPRRRRRARGLRRAGQALYRRDRAAARGLAPLRAGGAARVRAAKHPPLPARGETMSPTGRPEGESRALQREGVR